jgi:hypothetical protein
LFTTLPALTLAFSDFMNALRSGGQVHGILIPLTPSQSPVPVGFTPALTPNCGTRAGFTSRFIGTAKAEDAEMSATEMTAFVNFMT